MGLLLFYAFISIFFSFLCSILEAVLLSVTHTFINVEKAEGKAYIADLEDLKKDVDKPLISILTLNTIAHTVGAILVGVQAKVAYTQLKGDSGFKLFGFEISEAMMVGAVSSIMTVLILVASEIIPKTIGATYWKQLAPFSTKTLKFMVFALKWTGLLWLLQLFTRLVGSKDPHSSKLTREDFSAMAAIAEQEGAVKESESRVINNLLKLGEIQAKDIMTPKPVMRTAARSKSFKEFADANPKIPFSRIPTHGEKADEITGFILKDEVLETLIAGNGDQPLSSVERAITTIERETPLPKLFEAFLENREHIALVVDEFGATSGLVTLEDVVETLLGLEIVDENDSVADLQQLARKKWEERAQRLGIATAEDIGAS